MMISITNRIFGLLRVPIVLWTSVAALAQPKYPDLLQEADGVVVGKIAATQQNPASARLMLLVDRVLKGSLLPGQTINVLWDGPQPSRPSGQWGDYGIWFLKSTGNANWRLIRVPASRSLADSCYPLPEGIPPPIAVASGAAPTPFELTLAELSNAAERFDPHGIEFYLTVNGFLHMPSSPALIEAFRHLKMSSNFQVRVLGLTGLIFQGDATALDQLPLDSGTVAQIPTLLSSRMAGAISTVRDRGTGTITALGRIASTETAPIGMRRSAAEALAKIHTKDSLPILARLLDSQDALLRNHAFDGFSRFVMNLPIEKPEMGPTMAWMTPQGPAPYRNAETDRHIGGVGIPQERHAEYVAFWKAWWSRMKDQIH